MWKKSPYFELVDDVYKILQSFWIGFTRPWWDVDVRYLCECIYIKSSQVFKSASKTIQNELLDAML